ncbi:orotidine-5'-phosphate decarboxylase [Actinocorallia longicatena]|uniref:Orotidine-5'-phosphate decarboxylase n=1 Tax=Actinocorallia longicatena TaxID=111803 RepID=A0ABP6QK34_9ACTN
MGIDPSPALLAAWGLPDTPEGLERFSRTVVEAVGDLVAVVKPQSAFFERHGSRGIAVLETVLAELRRRGTVVVLDAKRGDIGSTTAAYADAYLDRSSPLSADAVTVTPYLGFGSLQPMIDKAAEHDAGLFVLARTSNPEGAGVQLAVAADGRTVGGTILDEVAALNRGAAPLGSLGVVLGATLTGLAADVAGLNGPVLAPGVGAQGADPAGLRRTFGTAATVVPSVSRGLLARGPGVADLREGARRLIDECAEALS